MQQSHNLSIISKIIVFLAGFSFLVFEVSWNRLLSLYLGSTVFASTLVLATFMGGIGLGGLLWGQYINKGNAPKHLLSYLFTAISLCGLGNYLLFQYGLANLYEILSSTNIIIREVIVYSSAFITLIVSAFFMGGVLPVVSKILIRSNANVGHHIGLIYALETLGSATGGLITGFVLLGQIGQQNTIFVAIFTVAITALISRKYMPLPFIKPQETPPPPKKQNTKKGYQKPALMLTFISGFAVMGLQISWVRILKVYLTNTSYTFALIAALVIAGLFLGSWLYKRRSTPVQNHYPFITNLLITMAALSILGLIVLLYLPELMLIPLHELFSSYYTRLLIIPIAVSVFVIIPVAAVSGYTFPYAIDLYTKSYVNVGRNVGRVMLANALGAFTGPLIVAFAIIPWFGAGKGIIIISIFLLISLFIIASTHSKTQRIISAAAITLLFGVVVSGMKLYILPPSFYVEDKDVIYYDESIQGSVVVGEKTSAKSTVKSTYVNNATVIGSSYDAIKAVKMVGHMPFFSGLECNNALVVGFGIGVTTSAIASHQEVKNIDCVELVPGLKKAARYYSKLNKNIVNDPRLTIYGGDGRHFLQSNTKKYDLISSDPTHPILGSGNLYTKSYFKLYRKHLTADGMVTQYLPLHKLNRDDLLGLIKTFHSVFPDAVVWLGHYHAVLMGSKNPIKIDFNNWKNRIDDLQEDMYFYTNPYHLAATHIFDAKAIKNFPANIKVNTDDHSYVEFFDFSVFEEDNLPANLDYLNKHRTGVYRTFQNIPDNRKMLRFIRGNQYMTKGLEGMLRQNKKVLYQNLQKAIRVNPENEEYPFLLKLYFR